MESWRSLFTQSNLNKGRAYYKQGKAKKLSRVEEDDGSDVYEATVRGSRNYKVEIEAWNGVVQSMSCTCPYAAGGVHCKHEAAVLMVIERDYEKLMAPDGKVGRTNISRMAAGKDETGTTQAAGRASGAASGSGQTKDNADKAGAAGAAASTSSLPSGKLTAKLSEEARKKERETAEVVVEPDNTDENLAFEAPRNAAKEQEIQPVSLPALDELQQAEVQHRKELALSDPDAVQYRPEAYRYFHPENFLKGLNISATMLKNAQKILDAEEEGKRKASRKTSSYYLYREEIEPLENFRVVFGYPRADNSAGLVGEATAYQGDYMRYKVTIDFDQDQVVSASCTNWECTRMADGRSYLGYRLCVHEVALLLKTIDYLKNNNVGDATSLNGEALLHTLVPMADSQTQDMQQAEGDGGLPKAQPRITTKILSIEPHMELDHGNLSAVFYIGAEKPYKIKDLNEFDKNMKAHASMNFGTRTTLPMGVEFLKDAAARGWYSFISGSLEERLQRDHYYSTQGNSYWPQNEIKANIPLFGSTLDRFAQLAGNGLIQFWDKGLTGKDSKKSIRVRDTVPRISLEIHAMTEALQEAAGKTANTRTSGTTPGRMDGIRITGKVPEFFRGQDSFYYIDGPYLNRVSREESDKIAPLVRSADKGKIDIRIGRAKLSDFYHKALPQLRQMADVTEYDTDLIQPYIPPQPEFTAYFDTENQSVLCRLEAAYGPQLFAATDVIEAIAQNKRQLEPSYRDVDLESQYAYTAYQYLPQYDFDLHVLFCQKNDEAVFDLLDHGLAELASLGEVRMTQRFKSLGIRRHFRFNIGVSVESNLLDLTMSSEDLTEDEMYEILYQYQRKRRFVKLKNGTFVNLENNETVAELIQIMETLQVPLKQFVKGKMQLPAYRALYLDKMLEGTEDLYASRDKRFKELIKEFKTVEDADFDVPQSLEKVLRKYQKDGYRWLRTLDRYGFGGILADEMGLGKTVEVIAVLLAVKEEEPQTAALPLPDHGMAITDGSDARKENAGEPGNKGREFGTDQPAKQTTEGKEQVSGGKGAVLDLTVAGGELPAVRAMKKKTSKTRNGVTVARTGWTQGKNNTKKPSAMVSSRTSIVICPASLVYNWEEEIHRFAPALSVGVVAGAAAERKEVIRHYEDKDVLVTSYDLLKRDIAEYEDCAFRFEIIDEAQYIKNTQTAAAKAVKLIRARTKYALTGTPIENRLSELWSIFDYLMPGFLYSYEEFRGSLELPIAQENEAAAERLRKMVAPFILRRRKEDVLKDLPEKLEEVRYVAMEGKQLQLYDAQVMKMKADLEDQSDVDFRKGKIEILAELTRIRQLCCDPALVYSNYDGSSAKREAAVDMIRTLLDEGHRALLFSQFTSMLELLEADLHKEGIAYYKITGSTPKAKRIALVKQFNENEEGVGIFLISLKAGGTGLNLTGADVVIHYDPWWNTAAEDQATDRAHRIGQKKVVTVYKLICRDSIEDRIMEMQNRKKDLADQVLTGEGVASASISREDLMEILE